MCKGPEHEEYGTFMELKTTRLAGAQRSEGGSSRDRRRAITWKLSQVKCKELVLLLKGNQSLLSTGPAAQRKRQKARLLIRVKHVIIEELPGDKKGHSRGLSQLVHVTSLWAMSLTSCTFMKVLEWCVCALCLLCFPQPFGRKHSHFLERFCPYLELPILFGLTSHFQTQPCLQVIVFTFQLHYSRRAQAEASNLQRVQTQKGDVYLFKSSWFEWHLSSKPY